MGAPSVSGSWSWTAALQRYYQVIGERAVDIAEVVAIAIAAGRNALLRSKSRMTYVPDR
jgi:hypothetical protein